MTHLLSQGCGSGLKQERQEYQLDGYSALKEKVLLYGQEIGYLPVQDLE